MIELNLDLDRAGREMHSLAARLFPICRSITGAGVRQTLTILQEWVPLEITEVPTGTQVFDWEVPREWNIRDAYIQDSSGRRIVDFRESNLHVQSGSAPIRSKMPWSMLRQHIHTLPEQPDWIPYRTCFHEDNWGFCLTHRLYQQLEADPAQSYEVCIDASLEPGSLTLGEVYLPGATSEEVLISTHCCHPSLANDNLSGITVATQLALHLMQKPRRYSYRFLFLPATIGPITWLSLNESALENIRHGLVLAVIGDPGQSTYCKSRDGEATIDRAIAHVLHHSGKPFEIREFAPFGFDQRQFCSPGINLPMGCLMRSPDDEYPEYHSSADNLNLIQPKYLADSWSKCVATLELLEHDRVLVNQHPKCEPRLGTRGLYQAFGQDPDQANLQKAVQWVLNLSDGQHSLLDIAERANTDFFTILKAADLLEAHELLEPSTKKSPTVTLNEAYFPQPLVTTHH